MGIEPPANTEFLPLCGITHTKWARECWANLKIGMFVNPSEEWVREAEVRPPDIPRVVGLGPVSVEATAETEGISAGDP